MEFTHENIDTDWVESENWTPDMDGRMAWLRANAPVYWSEKSQLFILSRFEEIAFVSKNPEIFCSGRGILPRITIRQGLIDEDAPRHTQLRSLINKGFTPRMVGKLEEAFVEITRETIDAIAEQGECDFVEDIAVPLLLIAEMIGIEKEDRTDFHRWSDAMMAGQGNFEDPGIMAAAGAAFVEYSTYANRIIEDRRANPRDDLVSILTGAKDAGVLEAFDIADSHGNTQFQEGEIEMANDELTMMLVLLMVAGNETTRNALSGAMELLIRNPEARQALIDDPSKIPDAVEELLRLVSPVRSFARTATRDTTLSGAKIREGQQVLMVYPSANRDENVFEDPDSLRLDRKPRHLAFGIGSHFCLGANLARMELRVAIGELLRRLPDMRFANDGPVVRPHSLVRACTEMKVAYTPESRRG